MALLLKKNIKSSYKMNNTNQLRIIMPRTHKLIASYSGVTEAFSVGMVAEWDGDYEK